MKTKNYVKYWGQVEKQPDFREYILPKRTDDEFWAEGKAQAEALQKYIKPENTVLEFGCGIGRILRYVKAEMKIGVDVSPGFLKLAEKHDITTIPTDGVKIGLPDNYVDVVYSIAVLQHCPKSDHSAQIAEMIRVCKSGGKVIIQFPRHGGKYYRQTNFVNVYKADELKKYCEDLGLFYSISPWDLVNYGGSEPNKHEWLLIIEK